jgi:hypothetical protein
MISPKKILNANKIIGSCRNPELIRIIGVGLGFSIKEAIWSLVVGWGMLYQVQFGISKNGFQIVILMSFRGNIILHVREEISY